MLRWTAPAALVFVCLATTSSAQSRLVLRPEHAEAERIGRLLPGLVTRPSLPERWESEDAILLRVGGEWRTMNLTDGSMAPASAPPRAAGRAGRGRSNQTDESPDGAWSARLDGLDLVLTRGDRTDRISGSPTDRIRQGRPSWVYSEELSQREGFGFSPDSRLLWRYEFDESKVPDVPTMLNQTRPLPTVRYEAYPKPGGENPVVRLVVRDLETGIDRRVEVGPAAGVGHYVYAIRWLPDGRLLFHRMNRRQNVREIAVWSPQTGQTTTLDREENPGGWVEYDSALRDYDADWSLMLSERSGDLALWWLNLRTGEAVQAVQYAGDVMGIERVDSERGEVWFQGSPGFGGRRMAVRAPLSPGRTRPAVTLTEPDRTHRFWVSPSGNRLITLSESATRLPELILRDRNGRPVRTLGAAESKLESEGLQPARSFSFTAEDGTKLMGHMELPPRFDPKTAHPVLVQVYNGPLYLTTPSWTDRFEAPSRAALYGFVVLELESRGTAGRGRSFRQALAGRMGRIEVDDIAAGVREALKTPGLDADRVAIEGVSYGGYVTLMALLRHPDLFHAGISQSPVSDWRNYDTTYTERYMGLLPQAAADYDAGSAVVLADRLRGDLMLYYGSQDDNTHPVNVYQMAAALNRAARSFDMMVGPDQGHGGLRFERRMEFLFERLNGRPGRSQD
ncbi:MAG: S9 family peptidase [Fimbriimonadaceae bacterium]|nr:S9 family peptidase [Fimbriimonadaceae bacterium]